MATNECYHFWSLVREPPPLVNPCGYWPKAKCHFSNLAIICFLPLLLILNSEYIFSATAQNAQPYYGSNFFIVFTTISTSSKIHPFVTIAMSTLPLLASISTASSLSSKSSAKFVFGQSPPISSNSQSGSSISESSSTSTSDSSDRWHTVSAYVGSEISMPCAVDVAGCGRIYFITWTKNVSNLISESASNSDHTSTEIDSSKSSSSQPAQATPSSTSSLSSSTKSGEWQRVFIHSDTFERVLGDLEQYGPLNRVHFGPKNLSQTNFAYLSLRTVVPEDEGVYKCDVTYVTPHAHGKCPSLTYIRVQTLVKPSSPMIRINGKSLSEYRLHQELLELPNSDPNSSAKDQQSSDIDLLRNRQIGPFEEGSTIAFECSTFGGRPMPELRWFNGSRPLRSKITVVDLDIEQDVDLDHHSVNADGTNTARRKILATTRIIASRYDLGAKFECRVLWNNTDFQNHWDSRHKSLLGNASLLNDWLLLDIKVRPVSIRVDSPRSPVLSGETVLLRCSVDGARPPANITWYNRSEVVIAEPLPSFTHLISNKQESSLLTQDKASQSGVNQPAKTRITTELMTDGTYRSTSILVFVATRSDHQADFFCKGSNEVLRNRNEVPLLQGVQLQVLYPPVVAIEPDGLIAVNESSTIQFWCTFDANPMNISEILWYKDHRPIDFIKWSADKNKIWSSKDERGTPTLTIRDIDRNDSAQYGCRVKNQFGTSDSITTAKLEVAYPPVVTLEIIEPKNQLIEERSNLPLPKLTLRCSTLLGNPPQLSAVHWYHNGRHFLTTVSFRHLQAQQSQQPIALSTSSTTPSFLHHSFYHRIGTGKHFTLVDESTPLAGPVNGQFLLSTNGTYAEPYVHYLNEPEMLVIANVTREHAGNYSCLGFNGAANASRLSMEKFIAVKYPPGPASLTLTSSERFILKGSQALLECRIDEPGDPPAHTIIWTHNGIRIDRATTQFKQTISDIRNPNPMIARFRTPKADMSTSGEYRCRAINDLGQGEWGTFRLDVKSPPQLLQSLPQSIGALSDQNLTLTCRVECQPPCQIHWFHNNLTRLSPDIHGILPSSLITNEYRAKLRNGNELTFSVVTEQTESLQGPAHTLSTMSIHNTSVLFDFDQLTCVSSNSDTEELGPPVYSTVIFRREYLPHSVHLSVPGIDLLEGEGYPEKPIQCSAFGNPPPQYYWTFDPFIVTMVPGFSDNLHDSPRNQTVVAIGPRLTLDKSIAQGRMLESMNVGVALTSTTSPGRFHASRTLSGNYTCMASNQHGSASATLTINVFYRPECELRRINTAKILRRRNQNDNNNHNHLSPPVMSEQVPIMLSCTAISNPAPAKFSWFRRNGSELLEIHPSINSDHSLFVAISQDYDYANDGTEYYHQNRPHISDYTLPVSGMGHTRQSIVMGVPPDANLDEYACVVANAIGESRPCWFEESPTSGQMSASGSSSNDDDNLFMVAASAGLIVFCLVLFSAVAVVFCLHRHRTSSFKGFGSRNLDVTTTPQRFKLDRPHLLLDSSSPEQLADMDFMMETRSKTATLTAGYRMTGAPNQLTAPLITGTLSKPYHRQHQNPYSTTGSVYANGDDSNPTNGLSASRPFLVSYPSLGGNPVYSEPEYHCAESSNPSGDGQLTGSTSVTTSSGANSNTSNFQLLPPDIKMRFPIGKFNSNKQGNNNVDVEMDELPNQNDENHYQNNYSNYEEVKDPESTSSELFQNSNRKKRRKHNRTTIKSSPIRSPSDYSRTSESDYSDTESHKNITKNDSVECLENRKKTVEPDYESYDNEENDDDDEDSSVPSTAYKPERDFFFINNRQQQPSIFRNSISSNSGGSSGSKRRLLPTTNKYGSLIRQDSSAVCSPRLTPQQYHQSPVSTRLYYNFHLGPSPAATSAPNPFHNSLRYGNNGWLGGRGGGVTRQHSDNGSPPPPLPPLPSDSLRASSNVYKHSESNEPLQQPPDYHQTILDRFYEQQCNINQNQDNLYR